MTKEPRSYRLYQAIAFKLRGFLIALPLICVFLLDRWEWEYDIGVWGWGLSLFLSGIALRVWSQKHLRYRLRDKHSLATEGPYALMRNPVYVGNLLLVGSFCVMCELPWAMPLVLAWGALVYAVAVRFEESRLLKRFGEPYAAYCRSVPRWWPRGSAEGNVRAPGAGFWRAFAVEWQCLLLPVAAILKEWWL